MPLADHHGVIPGLPQQARHRRTLAKRLGHPGRLELGRIDAVALGRQAGEQAGAHRVALGDRDGGLPEIDAVPHHAVHHGRDDGWDCPPRPGRPTGGRRRARRRDSGAAKPRRAVAGPRQRARPAGADRAAESRRSPAPAEEHRRQDESPVGSGVRSGCLPGRPDQSISKSVREVGAARLEIFAPASAHSRREFSEENFPPAFFSLK